MEDTEIAALLLARCSRRMSGIETAICQAVQHHGGENAIPGLLISTQDRRVFEGLKTQFASDLANTGKVGTP